MAGWLVLQQGNLSYILWYRESHVCMHIIRKKLFIFWWTESKQHMTNNDGNQENMWPGRLQIFFLCVTIVLLQLSRSKSIRPLYQCPLQHVYNVLCNCLTEWKFETIAFVIDSILILVSFVGPKQHAICYSSHSFVTGVIVFSMKFTPINSVLVFVWKKYFHPYWVCCNWVWIATVTYLLGLDSWTHVVWSYSILSTNNMWLCVLILEVAWVESLRAIE